MSIAMVPNEPFAEDGTEKETLGLSVKILDLLKQVASKPSQRRSQEELTHVQTEMLNWIYGRHQNSLQPVEFNNLETGMLNWIMRSSFSEEIDPPDIRTIMNPDFLAAIEAEKQRAVAYRNIEKPNNLKSGLIPIAFIVQLMKEEVDMILEPTDKIVVNIVKKLRSLAKEVHSWMMEAMVQEKHVSSLMEALSTKWSNIPLTIRDQACLRYEIQCKATLNIDVGRCQNSWLAEELLHKRTARKKISFKKNNKDPNNTDTHCLNSPAEVEIKPDPTLIAN